MLASSILGPLSLGIVKIFVGITMTFEEHKGIEKLNPMDNILSKARPRKNFKQGIFFKMEINIYNRIIYSPHNQVATFLTTEYQIM